ncbi:MAG: AI-2E family transporter [Proteobacteria bacterium]|nr:AI-2E family transporter [Pseudomonadota bacterium]
MSQPTRISYGFMAAMLLVVAMLGLATPLLTVLFSIFALNVFSFKSRSKTMAVALFLIAVTSVCLGTIFFFSQAILVAPKIAEKLVPTVVEFCTSHGIELPFKNVDSLIALIKTESMERLGLAGLAATHALRQTAFVLIGMVVAISLFYNAAIVIDRDKHTLKNNLYSLSADELTKRFELFYRSFHTVMGAQILISFINTGMTGIFLMAAGYPYWQLLLCVTFLCGLLPILGNILSNTIIVSVGLTVDFPHALGALAFLVVVHKLEYFLNSKIIGKRIQNPMWMTLLGLILGERLMGVPGMILAPVILHYVKSEASRVAVEQKADTVVPVEPAKP